MKNDKPKPVSTVGRARWILMRPFWSGLRRSEVWCVLKSSEVSSDALRRGAIGIGFARENLVVMLFNHNDFVTIR
jgi:hypothetical protein